MNKSIINPTKKKIGRPKIDSDQVNTRYPRELLNALDVFMKDQPELSSRSEAIRFLLNDHLIDLGYLKND